MPPRSTIDRLPPERRAVAEAILTRTELTVDEMVELLHKAGIKVGRTAAYEQRKRYEGLASKIRETNAIATAFAAELGPELADDATGRHLIQVLQTIVFRCVAKSAEDEDGTTAQDIHFLARALKDMQSAMSSSVKREAELRKRIAAEAAKSAEAAGKEAGLSAETVELIKRRILGVRDDASPAPA